MPPFNDSRNRAASPFTHPVSEPRSGYLAMTAAARPRTSAEDRRPYAPEVAGFDAAVQIRVEELWDVLGDFA